MRLQTGMRSSGNVVLHLTLFSRFPTSHRTRKGDALSSSRTCTRISGVNGRREWKMNPSSSPSCDRLRVAHRVATLVSVQWREKRSSLRFRLTVKARIREQNDKYKGAILSRSLHEWMIFERSEHFLYITRKWILQIEINITYFAEKILHLLLWIFSLILKNTI